jgi:hypothetical protein
VFSEKAFKNLNTICMCTESTDLMLEAFKKISIWWPNPFKNPPVPVNNIHGSACEEGR